MSWVKPVEVSTLSDLHPVSIESIDFVEFSSSDPAALARLFEQFKFVKKAYSTNGKITQYQQGNINFLLTADVPFSCEFANKHGPSACSVGVRVKNLNAALNYFKAQKIDILFDYQNGLPFPALKNIDGSRLYLMDSTAKSFYNTYPGFKTCNESSFSDPNLFYDIDHMAYNLNKNTMDSWIQKYSNCLNFFESYKLPFNPEVQIRSKVIRSKNNKVAWSLNESQGDSNQIDRYLKQHQGPGMQHIAFITHDIFETMKCLKQNHIEFMVPPPDEYYEQLKTTLPQAMLSYLPRIKQYGLLVDRKLSDQFLLQIFTKPNVGPMFFEIIQRVNGYEGFGDDNVKVLFECMEKTLK